MVRGWTLVDLASLSIMLLRVFMEMATISKWCLVHLWGAKCTPFDTCVLMALLFLAPVYAEYAMWIWSATSPLLYVLYFFVALSLSLSRNLVYFISTCIILYMFCKYDLLFVLFSIAVDHRNLVTHEMLKMQYMLWMVGMLMEVASL